VNWSVEYGDYEAGDPGSPVSRTRTRFMLQYKL